ncbi:MAG TPA: hypothetical protein VGE60_03625 [Telluria sp.]
MIQRTLHFMTAAAATAMLAACGGDSPEAAPQPTRIELLASSPKGMDSIAFSGGHAYVSLATSTSEGSALMRTALPVGPASGWSEVPLGQCGAAPANEYAPERAPGLQVIGNTLWMFQSWFEGPEGAAQQHVLCAMEPGSSAFVPKDEGLRACNEYYCSTLWMTDLKLAGTRLFSNAGGGRNLMVSDDQSASWRVLLGAFDTDICTHQAFHVMGDRVLVGGECPLDDAFISAYQLSADGGSLATGDELPITLPELENRNIQFIDSVPGTQRVFVGVEGGLLRSDDGGRSFKFVIHHPLERNTSYPYVRKFLTPKGKPETIVVGGFDKERAKPFLAWSANGGDTWTDLSHMLPGAQQEGATAQVMDLAEAPDGRLLIVLNEKETTQGRLLSLTLGQP